VYPFVSAGGLGHRGPLIGRDLLGGSFCFDPWVLYQVGFLTNPNVLVVGQIGRGKSALVKTFVWRQLAFGRQGWIVDPKGEYGRLAEAAGAMTLRLRPGGRIRLNPLALPLDDGDDRWRAELVATLIESSLERVLSPQERTAVDLAVRTACRGTAGPTLRHVVDALLDPDPAAARTVRTDPASLAGDGRPVALELRRLVDGDLAGMFDGPTSPGLDFRSRLVVLDLSAVFASPALPVLMACATAWLAAVMRGQSGTKRLVVIDEAWAVIANLATARWLQAMFKLSRALGVANVAVVHRLSDLKSAGADGSAQQRLAEGLLADSETRVIFAQSHSEIDATGALLGLTDTEQDLIARLPRGVALWQVGDRSFLVEHALGAFEAGLTDTDAAMVDDR
jgi:type IV secretory pathway VirB4 component